jgi:hypothetical protein
METDGEEPDINIGDDNDWRWKHKER